MLNLSDEDKKADQSGIEILQKCIWSIEMKPTSLYILIVNTAADLVFWLVKYWIKSKHATTTQRWYQGVFFSSEAQGSGLRDLSLALVYVGPAYLLYVF